VDFTDTLPLYFIVILFYTEYIQYFDRLFKKCYSETAQLSKTQADSQFAAYENGCQKDTALLNRLSKLAGLLKQFEADPGGWGKTEDAAGARGLWRQAVRKKSSSLL
jgi:hypothetical protein